MMRPSVQGVDPPVCCTPGCYCYICKRQLCGFPQCAASWMTYARDSFVDSQGGLLSSRGGDVDTLAQTHWHQSYSIVKHGHFKKGLEDLSFLSSFWCLIELDYCEGCACYVILLFYVYVF